MKIAIGSDHGGFELKQAIMQTLINEIEWVDCGTYNLNSCDYPDFAFATASKVSNHECDYGIVICKSGIGMSIAANKVKGIRCALVQNETNAILSKQHNNSNMLALGANDVNLKQAISIIHAWLNASFLNDRHAHRIQKIMDYENQKQ